VQKDLGGIVEWSTHNDVTEMCAVAASLVSTTSQISKSVLKCVTATCGTASATKYTNVKAVIREVILPEKCSVL
jgi:hypothetical protein